MRHDDGGCGLTVTLIHDATGLRRPLPSGLVVVAAHDLGGAAARVAAAVGASRALTPGQARSELERRRSVHPPGGQEELAVAGATLEQARARAADAAARVAGAGRTVDPRELRRLAAVVTEADDVVAVGRADVGPTPRLDHQAAAAARRADDALRDARRTRAEFVDRSTRVLVLANATGAALVAARLATEAVDPAFFLVAVLPLAGLVFGSAGLVATARDGRAARRARARALRTNGVATLGGLAGREARWDAWAERAAHLAVAESAAVRARAAWHEVAGDGVEPADIEGVLAAVVAADAARLDVLSAEAAFARARDRCRGPAGVDVPAGGSAGRSLAEGVGARPLVVVDTLGAVAAETRRDLLDQLDRAGAATTVVLVTCSAATRAWARARAGPGAGLPCDGQVRERVVARFQRARSRAASGRTARVPVR